LSISYC